MASKRIWKEIKDIQKDPPTNYSARSLAEDIFSRGGFKETRAVADSAEVSNYDEKEDEEEDASMDADDDELSFGEDEISQSLYPLGSEESETNDVVDTGSFCEKA